MVMHGGSSGDLRVARLVRRGVLIAIVALGLLPWCISADAKYVWPLAQRFGISSTFGEYRNSAFHAGIDLKTATVTGLKVRAIDDGVIYRLCVNYRGFGKALYVRHPDGLISVYGHLQGFENKCLKLEEMVENRRKETGERYPGNIFISVAVKRGQTIAYSGETGYGFPHLHFEIRRGETKPVNPLSIFDQKDDTSPVINRLILCPLGPESLVNGQHDDVSVWFERDSASRFRSRATPIVSGRFVVLVNTYDTVAAANHCGVPKLDLFVDRKLVCSMRLEELEYGQSYRRAGLVYDHQYAYFSPPSYVYAMHNKYGAERPGEVSEVNRGVLDFSEHPGKHTIEVVVTDDAGNVSKAAIQVLADPQQEGPSGPSSGSQGLRGSSTSGAVAVELFDDFAEIWVRQTDELGTTVADLLQKPELIVIGGLGGECKLSPVSRGAGWVCWSLPVDCSLRGPLSFEMARGQERLTLSPSLDQAAQIVPRTGGTFAGGGLKVEFPSGALYADQIFSVSRFEARELRGVPLVGRVARKFIPEGIPLEKEVTVSFAPPRDMPQEDLVRSGVYEYNPKRKKWTYLDSLRLDDGSVAAGVRYLSIFGLCIDKAPPVIELLRPKLGARLRKGTNRLVVRIEDLGSGVDYRKTLAKIDGAAIDAEYDPDRKLLTGSFYLPKAGGKHRLHIESCDIAGNCAKPVEVTLP